MNILTIPNEEYNEIYNLIKKQIKEEEREKNQMIKRKKTFGKKLRRFLNKRPKARVTKNEIKLLKRKAELLKKLRERKTVKSVELKNAFFSK